MGDEVGAVVGCRPCCCCWLGGGRWEILAEGGWACHVGVEDGLFSFVCGGGNGGDGAVLMWRGGGKRVFSHRAIPAEAEEGVPVGELLEVAHAAGLDEGLARYGAVLGYFAGGHGLHLQLDEVALGRVVLERHAVVGVVEEGDDCRRVRERRILSEPGVVLAREWLEVAVELEIGFGSAQPPEDGTVTTRDPEDGVKVSCRDEVVSRAVCGLVDRVEVDKVPWPVGDFAVALRLELRSTWVLVQVDVIGCTPLEQRVRQPKVSSSSTTTTTIVTATANTAAVMTEYHRLAVITIIIKTDFLETIVQNPQPIQEFRLVCDDQRGTTATTTNPPPFGPWSEHLELVEIHRRTTAAGAAAYRFDGPVPLVHDDADTAAVGAALLALPVAEVRGVLVRAEVQVVDVVLARGAGGVEAGP